MTYRLTSVAVLVVLSMAMSADAETDCNVATDVWELELTRVESLAGDADLNAVAAALGTGASLRGGLRDSAHTARTPRAELVGTGGVGPSLSLEKREP